MAREIRPVDGTPSDRRDVVTEQREVNEELVLAVLHAHERADEQREANERLAVAAVFAHDAADAAAGAQRFAEDDASAQKVIAAELRLQAEDGERLIGMVGHDLRTPLTTVVLAAGRLVRSGHLTEADDELVRRIASSGKRMTSMVAELVEFTRARLGGGFRLSSVRCDLGEICSGIMEDLLMASPVDIQCTRVGDLGGTWDANRIAEVITNLATNAVDHAAPGTMVRIDAHDDGDGVVAEVTNRGTPIPVESLLEIFKPFHRGEGGAKTGGGHLGLGLYIAQEITRSHGGTLTVRSADDTTTFALRLPRAFCDDAAGTAGTPT